MNLSVLRGGLVTSGTLLYLMEMVFQWPFFSQRDSATEYSSSPTQWTRFGCLGPPGGLKLSLAAA